MHYIQLPHTLEVECERKVRMDGKIVPVRWSGNTLFLDNEEHRILHRYIEGDQTVFMCADRGSITG